MEGKNWITGYSPVSINIRHFANTFDDKKRYLKLKEKQFITSILNAELFKIKKQCRNVYMNMMTENVNSEICNICFKTERPKTMDNYFVNLLDINQLSFLRSTKTTYFKYLRLFLTSNKRSISCSTNLLQNKELLEFLQKSVDHYEKQNAMYHKKRINFKMLFSWVKKSVKNFTYTFSSFTFKIVSICWYTISHSFVKRLIVSSFQIQNIKKVNRDDRFPLVYVMKNGNKVDWLFILFVLYFLKLKTPVILLRKNSNSKMNWLCRLLGVVFIPPYKIQTNVKNDVYLESWIIYLEENLKIKNHMLFYLEDDADDTYILDTIIDSIKRNTVEDVLVSLVNVTCEKNVDQFAVNKILGGSFWSWILDLYSRKVYNFGFVNITFNPTFSLKELVSSLGDQEHLLAVTSKVTSHLKYDFSRSQVMLPINLVSFLLLKKFRNGVKLNDLISEVDELYSELKELKKPLGFTGNAEKVVNHVIKLLGTKQIIFDTSNIVKPVLELPYVLQIANYADCLLHHYMVDAVIMVSIATLFKDDLEVAFKGTDRELKFYYLQLTEKYEELSEILRFEYAFEKPCQMKGDEMREVLFRFISNNYFCKVENMLTAEEEWSRRMARHLEDTDSEESDDGTYSPTFRKSARDMGDSYIVNLTNEKSVLKEILFYKSIVKPLLDTYLVSVENLKTLIEQQMIDSVYYKKLIDKMNTLLEEKQLQFPESISLGVIKKSMKLFEKWGVIESYSIDGIQLFYLSPNYNAEDKLLPIIERIRIFQ